ncbi:MAG: hypothetical protein IT326_08160, partial [Anaerolineae bacterium]|nr:hypothetical protein [Anaerolineae bacterium]
LELSPDNPTIAFEALSQARESSRLPVEEVALYGAQIHVVAPEVEQWLSAIQTILAERGVSPGLTAVIPPSLEDVFISCIRRKD